MAIKSVAIVAMGQSSRSYLQLCVTRGDRRLVADETWAINSMGGVIQHDLLFHMDDLRIQESRAAHNPEGNIAGMLRWLKTHPKFFTSTVYDDFPGAIEYPLQDVINNLGVSYFNSTVSYAVAMAMHTGVERLALYGVDFSYPDNHKAEQGRACVEYLLGIASANGIHIDVSSDTTLLDANVGPEHKFYGYDGCDIGMEQTDAGVKIIRTSRETLPSAIDINTRYKQEIA